VNGIIDQPTAHAISVFVQVVLIDVVLSGDNAVVVGTAVAGLPPAERRRALWLGIAAATVLRLAFASVATTLLHILGLPLAGGILLLWVCWKLYRDIREAAEEKKAVEAMETEADKLGGPYSVRASSAMVRRAIVQIAAADLSMSLDNVLAVAGAARNHVVVLAIGLVLSIGLMGVAANMIARVLNRHPWISFAGLFIVLYVALSMIWRGGYMIMHAVPG
jgi:YjbE family integral membrane protein